MRFIISCFFIATSLACSAQVQSLSTKNKKAIELYTQADNYRVRGQWNEAISLLNEALVKDKNFEEAWYRLATIYKAQEKFLQAEETFEKGLALAKDDSRKRVYLYDLSSINLWQADYSATKDYAEKFLSIEKSDLRKVSLATLWKIQSEYALKNTQVYDYQINALSDTVNMFPMQYFPVITGDGSQLIFTARFGGTRNDNEDLVVSNWSSEGWTAPVSLSTNINTVMREGACTISADGRHLIFTVCGASGCDLYESRKTGNVWSKPKGLGAAINSPGWDAQPSLSADGRELYFVSDRKGGIGGYDIWYSSLEGSAWSKAINLGPSVNTPFDEISPYIHVNNLDLYVVSNGYPGYGGYDIYRVEKEGPGWKRPVNLGKPLNDHKDQYSFIVTADGAVAYYSREESRNRSRLYGIRIPEEKRTRSTGNVLKGTVTHVSTKQPLKANVELFDLKQNRMVSQVMSDSATGDYLIVLPGGSQYALYVNATGFLFNSQHFDYQESKQWVPLVKNIELAPVEKNATVVLNNIFFEVDKYELRSESITELQEVVRFMQQNAQLHIEIGGHTDNTGSESYNLVLSQKRAQSVADYLVSNEIPSSRVKITGYGSKKPLKPNDSEANKQLNRRIEFKIIP